MPSVWGLEQCSTPACNEMAKDLFGILTLINFKSSNLEDPNWSERSVGVLWQVKGRNFSSATNRCTPYVLF